MSEIKRDRCDWCGKETADRYAEVGWVRLGGMLSVSAGRPSPGMTSASKYWSGGERDFCSLDCFMWWVSEDERQVKP